MDGDHYRCTAGATCDALQGLVFVACDGSLRLEGHRVLYLSGSCGAHLSLWELV